MTAPPWTHREEEILRAGREAGRGYAAIAARLPGRTAPSCRVHAQKMGLAKRRKRDRPLYTARQAAMALIAAVRRFDENPEIIACAPGGRGVHQRVSRARKALALALAEENDCSAAAIAFALGWHSTRTAASVAFVPANLPDGDFAGDVRAIVAALRRACANDRPVVACGKEKYGVAQTSGPEPGEARVCAAAKKDPPRRAADSSDEVRAAPLPRPDHPSSVGYRVAGPGERDGLAVSQKPVASQADRMFGTSCLRTAPVRKADYSKMTPEQIAEHEMCEALLNKAEKHPDVLTSAQRLTREPGRRSGEGMRGVV